MNGVIEQRIARVAKSRGVSFNEAARLVARRPRKWSRARREREALTRLHSTWAWRRDFE